MYLSAIDVRDRPAVLYQAFRCFCLVTLAEPGNAIAYQCMAQCWRAVGDDALAERVLRSFQHAMPSPVIDEALDSIPKAQRRDPEVVRESVRRAERPNVASAWGKKPNCAVLI